MVRDLKDQIKIRSINEKGQKIDPVVRQSL